MEKKERTNVMLKPSVKAALRIMGHGSVSAGIEKAYNGAVSVEKSKQADRKPSTFFTSQENEAK